MITPANFPSPQTTLVIVLGASQWPYDEAFEASKAFEQAASKLRAYFLNTFGLPPGNLLWLFDTPLNARDIDKEIFKHLDTLGEKARDVLVYYTGHGRPTDDRSSLYLAIRDTQAHDPESSSLRFKSLARTLKAKARHLRRFYILDCCFAALGQNALQSSSVFDTLCQKTLEDVEIPLQGYAGLFSSGKDEMSVILPTHENTFFTEAFLQALLEGSLYKGHALSLKDIYALVEERLISLHKEYRLKYPETYKPPKPQLYAGDVAFIPLFPNPHAEQHHKAEAKRHRKSEVKRRRQTRRRKAAGGRVRGEMDQHLVPLSVEEDLEKRDVIDLPVTEARSVLDTPTEHAQEQISRNASTTSVEVSEERVDEEKIAPTDHFPIDAAPPTYPSQQEADGQTEPSSTVGSEQGVSRAEYRGSARLEALNLPEVPSQTPRAVRSVQKSTRQSGRLRRRTKKQQPPPGRSRYTPRPEISGRDKEENLRTVPAMPDIQRPAPGAPRASMPDFDAEEAFFEAYRRGAENVHSPQTSTRQSRGPTGKLEPSPGRSQLTPARETPDFDVEEALRRVPARAHRALQPGRRDMADKEALRRTPEGMQVVATPPAKKKTDFRKAVDFFFGRKAGARSTTSQPIETTPTERQLYTALRIGTTSVVAMIIEVEDDLGIVLGVGRHQHISTHMSDGIVTDISGVIDTCNKALLQAEEAAGGLIAPNAVIGIAGELVKGSSITVHRQRSTPSTPITPEELASLITSAQQKLLKNAKERIANETGYSNIEVRLIHAAIISAYVDGQPVSNPVGFRGQRFTLTLFSGFVPLMQLGALETVAQGLDLTLMTIVAEPYALARCLSRNASADSGAIIIDIGGGTTDIALLRQGGIEDTRMFALGGRTFTRRLASHKGLPLKAAEQLKIKYGLGNVKRAERDEIQQILAPEVATWMDSVELLIEELAEGELLPPAIYLAGGSSGLPDLIEKLKSFPWTERLPFAQVPIIQTLQPFMVTSISDPHHLLKNAQDITPMALAYQAVELQSEDSVLEKTVYEVIRNMRI